MRAAASSTALTAWQEYFRKHPPKKLHAGIGKTRHRGSDIHRILSVGVSAVVNVVRLRPSREYGALYHPLPYVATHVCQPPYVATCYYLPLLTN
jgi:hypothetical protein